MNRGGIFWGLVFVLVGGLLLVDNLFPSLFRNVSIWNLIWPAMLVVLGVWFLLGPTIGRKDLKTELVSFPLGSAAEAKIHFQHGGGRLTLRGGTAPGTLVSGTAVGGIDVETRSSGSLLDVRLKARPSIYWMGFPAVSASHGYEWILALTHEVPLSLEFETGASESTIDLHDLKVRQVEVKTGASSTELTLPAAAGETRVKVASGVASVKINVPQGVAGRIKVQSGLADIRIDTARFPNMGGYYETPGYAGAQNKADIFIETGVASVDIK